MSLKIVQNTVKRTVAVAAGKGGVGKSTLTVLLAAALKRQGQKVGVLDVDIYGPSIRQMLSEDVLPQQQEGKWIPAVANGIKFLSYSFFSKEHAVRAPIANQILRQLFQNVFWGELDWLLVDFPPGTGDIPLSATQLISFNGAVIVTTPQKVATLDVQKTLTMFQKVGVSIFGILENMSYFKEPSCTPFGSGGAARLAEENKVPFLGQIPLEPRISEYADRGKLHEVDLACLNPLLDQLKQNSENLSEKILSISVIDQKKLKIVWENMTCSQVGAEKLQELCPCAQCKNSASVRADVLLHRVEKVGNYGLKFDFSSGCSFGIYPFDLLKRFDSCN